MKGELANVGGELAMGRSVWHSNYPTGTSLIKIRILNMGSEFPQTATGARDFVITSIYARNV
jgi:hypothetical protein